MAAPTKTSSAFPSPYEIATPPGCEGWEEMYPYHALFDERRREKDENRFWFWNSMHFPVPMPAFDVHAIDSPYQAVGEWQNRFFAVPPAMGIDYRILNGYVYISGNPVTDPAKIGERVEYFQRRASYYFEHWDELYAKWKVKMEELIAEITELPVPDLPEYEPDEVMLEDDRQTAFYELLSAYDRTLRCGDLMWQHHFELLLLGYGAYVTFSDFCKANLPDIPDQHIAQMVAGIDVLLFKPSAELRRLAKVAIDSGVDGAFVEGRSHAEIDAELEQSDAGKAWLEELEKIGAQAGEVIGQTRTSPSRTAAICSTSITTRAFPSTTPGEAAAPVRRPSPSSALAHSWTRCVVTPQSMMLMGSVIASGVAPSAGGGVQPESFSSSSLRRATIGGQCFGPIGSPPVAQVRTSSSSACPTSCRPSWKTSSVSSRKPCLASSAPNSRTLFHQRVRNQ